MAGCSSTRSRGGGGRTPKFSSSEGQRLIHVHLEEQGGDPSRKLPCKVYWDSYYDLGGKKTLRFDTPSIGGKWPWFMRSCHEDLPVPFIYTQKIRYNSPKDMKPKEEGGKGLTHMKDLKCV